MGDTEDYTEGGGGVEGSEALTTQKMSENLRGVEGLRGLSLGGAGQEPPPLPPWAKRINLHW